MAKCLQVLRNLRSQDLHSFLVLASITSTGINIFPIGFCISDIEYILITVVISMCILISSPLHYANTPIRSQCRSSSIICLLLFSIISLILIFIKYQILLLVFAEILLSIIILSRSVLPRIDSVARQIQKEIAHKKLENATGWLHYPTGRIAGALYYSVVFAVYAMRFYSLTGCSPALFVFVPLFILSTFLLVFYFPSIIVFNQSVIVKISACHSKALPSDSIYRVTSHGSKWLLYDKSGKIILKVPHSMVGDMRKLILMSKSRKAKKKKKS